MQSFCIVPSRTPFTISYTSDNVVQVNEFLAAKLAYKILLMGPNSRGNLARCLFVRVAGASYAQICIIHSVYSWLNGGKNDRICWVSTRTQFFFLNLGFSKRSEDLRGLSFSTNLSLQILTSWKCLFEVSQEIQATLDADNW